MQRLGFGTPRIKNPCEYGPRTSMKTSSSHPQRTDPLFCLAANIRFGVTEPSTEFEDENMATGRAGASEVVMGQYNDISMYHINIGISISHRIFRTKILIYRRTV